MKVYNTMLDIAAQPALVALSVTEGVPSTLMARAVTGTEALHALFGLPQQ